MTGLMNLLAIANRHMERDVKAIAEYAFVAAGGVFLGSAVLNFMWFLDETYPRSVPTALAIPGCLIAFVWCLMRATDIMIGNISLPPQP